MNASEKKYLKWFPRFFNIFIISIFLNIPYLDLFSFLLGSYPILLIIIPSSFLFFFFKRKLYYKSNLNSFILILYFLITLLLFSIFLTTLYGNVSIYFLLKISLFFMFPIVSLMILQDTSFKDLKLILKVNLIVSCIFQIVFSIILGHYNIAEGKFISNDKTLLNYSSNDLSIIMVSNCLVFYLLLNNSRKIKITGYNKWNLLKALMYIIPIIHLSKAHIVSYFFSILILLKKWLKIILIFVLILISFLIYNYSSDLNLYIKNKQINQLIVFNNMLWNLDINIFDISRKVSGRNREYIYEREVFLIEKKVSIVTGLGDKGAKELLNGKDFHNIYYYFLIQFGYLSCFAFVGVMFLYLYFILKIRNINFKKIYLFIWIYIALRGFFITINPLWVLFYFSFILIFYWKLKEKK